MLECWKAVLDKSGRTAACLTRDLTYVFIFFIIIIAICFGLFNIMLLCSSIKLIFLLVITKCIAVWLLVIN